MSARKFLAALLLAVMAASCSFAEVTTLQILQDVRFSPHIPATKLNGPSLLPGRYIVAENIASRTGSQPIIAPAKTILEIGQFSAETNTYPFHLDVHGKGKLDGRVVLDIQPEAPVLKFYTVGKSGQYEPSTSVYAVVMQQGRDHAWLTGAVSDGEMSFLFPLSDINFPEGWYLGEWKCEDGSQLTLEGNRISSNGHEIGTFTVEDDRITVTAQDGSTDTIYAMRNPVSGTLIMTFTSGPNGMGMNAGSFVNMSTTPKPAAPKTPVTPEPESKPAPQMPTEFPPLPNVKMPPQSLNINGVWGAYYDGHQLITQFQGDNYYGWIDGQPSEMGIIRVEGNTITGSNNKGVDFTAELELDASGKFLDMKFPNGNVIHYQRLQ